LRVEVTPDRHVGVLQARGEHADSHLTLAGRWQGSVDHLQIFGTAEAPELDDPVTRLTHGRIPYNSWSSAEAPARSCFADRPALSSAPKRWHGPAVPIARNRGHVIEAGQ
jgi:hypothetical protein